MRAFTFADANAVYAEVMRHWSKHPVLGALPLVQLTPSHPPRRKPLVLPLPHARAIVVPRECGDVLISVTIWHQDEVVLKSFFGVAATLFPDPFAFDGVAFFPFWSVEDEMEVGSSQLADKNGVVPYLLTNTWKFIQEERHSE